MTNNDPIGNWMATHPWTLLYVAVVVTLILILQAAESF